eukprot:TRINITY_DN18157_c0_g1_i1.p5 TRINITY_DN18157_c0_g1~~TRINITY_DN18157_c0_g1_i1.p5  ORF type:complete len:101 (+),score=49.74 TRINITY_DN18157_c0_g1_i1:93-395(+)
MGLFFVSHCVITPLVSKPEMLRTKAALKMTVSAIAVGISFFVNRDLFALPTFKDDEPVVMVVKYISYSLCVDVVLFALYLALGFGKRSRGQHVPAAKKQQ